MVKTFLFISDSVLHVVVIKLKLIKSDRIFSEIERNKNKKTDTPDYDCKEIKPCPVCRSRIDPMHWEPRGEQEVR